jgi:hypothetical protein
MKRKEYILSTSVFDLDFKSIMKLDPLFVEAQGWGAFPGFLVNKIYELGLPAVRRSIAYVSSMGTQRLYRKGSQHEPEALKRWKYLKYLLNNGGVYEYKREYQQARDEGWTEWAAACRHIRNGSGKCRIIAERLPRRNGRSGKLPGFARGATKKGNCWYVETVTVLCGAAALIGAAKRAGISSISERPRSQRGHQGSAYLMMNSGNSWSQRKKKSVVQEVWVATFYKRVDVEIDLDISEVLDEFDTEEILEYLAKDRDIDIDIKCLKCSTQFNVLFHLSTDQLKTLHCPICMEVCQWFACTDTKTFAILEASLYRWQGNNALVGHVGWNTAFGSAKQRLTLQEKPRLGPIIRRFANERYSKIQG